MPSQPLSNPFDTRLVAPIRIKPDGPRLASLEDVRAFFVGLTDEQHNHPDWDFVARALLGAANEPTPSALELLDLALKNALLTSLMTWEE